MANMKDILLKFVYNESLIDDFLSESDIDAIYSYVEMFELKDLLAFGG
jgi:hypothetical protein